MQIHPQYVATANGNKDMEMLALALELAITAPTDAYAIECGAIADSIASNLTEEQVESCKAVVLDVLGMEDASAPVIH